MDIPIELLWLVLLGVYYLLSARRKGQQRKTPPPSDLTGEATEKPSGATPFAEFVRQMEEAMREASGVPPEPEPEPIRVEVQEAPPPPPMPVPTQRPVTSLGGRREPEFRDLGSFQAETAFETAARPDHDRHGFGLDQPFSEERFERLPRGLDETEHRHPSLAPASRPRRGHAAYWRGRLQDPKKAQEALVLTEIFAGPWSPRRPGRK